MPSLRSLRSVLVCFCFTCLSGLIWAQKDTGSIVGTVKDPSGAVVTGAKITVTDVDGTVIGAEATASAATPAPVAAGAAVASGK